MGFADFMFRVQNGLEQICGGEYPQLLWLIQPNLASPVKLRLRTFDVSCTAATIVMLALSHPRIYCAWPGRGRDAC